MWIESHQAIVNHPKTRKLARSLGVSIPCAVGHLHILWHWCVDYAPNGDLSRWEVADIAEGAMWEGDPQEFVEALVGAGLVDDDENVHDWDQYAGRLLAQRATNANRMRQARAAHVQRTFAQRVPLQDSTGQYLQDRTKNKIKNKSVLSDVETPDVPSEGERLCERLALLIEANGAKAPTVTKKWQDDADRMLRLDKRDPTEAEAVMVWATADSFWRANVLSMPTFRKHYDQLRLSMQRPNGYGRDLAAEELLADLKSFADPGVL